MLLSGFALFRLCSPPTSYLTQVLPKYHSQHYPCRSPPAQIDRVVFPGLPSSLGAWQLLGPIKGGTAVSAPVAPAAAFCIVDSSSHPALAWRNRRCTILQCRWLSAPLVMAKPVARWRRSGPRDASGFHRGPETSPPPVSTVPSGHAAPDMPRRFSSFRTREGAPTCQEPVASQDQDGGLHRGLSGVSSHSPSSAGTPAGACGFSRADTDATRGSFAVPASDGPTGGDPQSPTTLLFGNRGLEAFNRLTLDDEYILHFYGVRQTVRPLTGSFLQVLYRVPRHSRIVAVCFPFGTHGRAREHLAIAQAFSSLEETRWSACLLLSLVFSL